MTRALPLRRNAATADWTDERVARLTELWAAGWSYSKIAVELGGDITRSSVGGKVHRLKIGKRVTVNQFSTRPKSPPKRIPRSNLVRKAAPSTRLRPVVVYRPPMHADDADLIAGWLAANGGPRKFARGDSADREAMCFYLRERGYSVTYMSHGGAWSGKLTVQGPMGRPRKLTAKQLVTFVDELRMEEGLEPIKPTAEMPEERRRAA